MGWGTITRSMFFTWNKWRIQLWQKSFAVHRGWLKDHFGLWKNAPPVNSPLCEHPTLTVTAVCAISRGASRVTIMFSSPIFPGFFVSEASRLLTANGIALRLLCVWFRRDEAGDDCGIRAVSCEAKMSRKPSVICRSVWNAGSESFDMWAGAGAPARQLTNVDSTLTTMQQRCANNVLSDGNLHPL